ncbi:fluoride efflux transporter CrcB [Alterisphingorhabdus coralli]|uniref:Fluoride-specific ion channel FluC n=1 Tax=Alterisphingorhabdus coralli TaxID=3071408 RepID=A0AA97I030_9SPHN|nr:fluoride efflux transporter CrcB [Parasphingorhabdus sp. SCSIO 66989]WOE74462.1 fluoride efflux transporter CrcB [Parasphingorhabdus sp. SCSIO 66989]
MSSVSLSSATLLVALGGGLGAVGRFHLGRIALQFFGPGWPWGTLIANLSGGFLMGCLVGILAQQASGGETWRLLIGVGLLGGFTTFSAFSLETANMVMRGEWGVAAGYALLSVIASVAALFGGLMLARLWV